LEFPLNADSIFNIWVEETDCKQRWPALFAHSASLDPPLSIIALQQVTAASHKALLKTRGMCKDWLVPTVHILLRSALI
jgi:hypothetical protein